MRAITLPEDSVVGGAVRTHLSAVVRALTTVSVGSVEPVVAAILEAHAAQRHVYVLGNGGSASTATHFACDLSKATVVQGRARLRVTALNDNVALLTAWANDSAYDQVFAEPLRNHVDQGDVVIALSVSGSSPNVLEAVRVARAMGAVTVGLTGSGGGRLVRLVDIALAAGSTDHRVVEDCHLALQHAITAATRAALDA
jgi:D-sedoheptulose 7-phosphate isomerase